MYALSSAQMRALEDRCAEAGIRGFTLMENAGRAAALAINGTIPVKGKKCVVFCGSGNNGGDGFIVAAELKKLGAEVQVILCFDLPKGRTAREAYEKAYAAEVPKVYRYSCYYWVPVAMVLLAFSLRKGILSRILSNRFLVTGGEISYSFYLIHLFVLLSYAEWQKASGFSIAWYISVPILFGFIVALSLLSYRYFEKPMNKRVKLWLNKENTKHFPTSEKIT